MPIQIFSGGQTIVLSTGPGTNSATTIGNTGGVSGPTPIPVYTSVTALGDNNITVTGSPINDGSGTLIIGMAPSGVMAGTYSFPVLTVDRFGCITAAASEPAPTGAGTVVDVEAAGDPNITVTGGPITTAGTFSVSLNETGVAAGTYSKVTVDTHGRVTGAASLGPADINAALGTFPVAAALSATSANSLTYRQQIALSGDVSGTGQFNGAYPATIVTALASVGTAGTYGSGSAVPVIVTDANGRVTSVSTVSFAATATPQTITLAGDVTGSGTGTVVVTLAAVGTAGTYSVVTTDGNGRVVAGRGLSGADIVNTLGVFVVPHADTANTANIANAATGFANPQTLALVGDASGATAFDGSGPVSLSVALNPTAVVAGTYVNATVAIGADGRVTAAESGTDWAAFSSTVISAGGISLSENVLVNHGTLAIGLAATGVVAGTYVLPSIAVDATGRVTTAASGDIGSFIVNIALPGTAQDVYIGRNYFNQAEFRGVSGDANVLVGLSPDNTSLTVGLSPTGVAPGTYASANLIVDAWGRLTAAANGSSGGSSPAGSPVSVDATGDANITVTGGPITTSGTFTISLGTTTVTAGSYGNFAVDGSGRLTYASSPGPADITAALGTFAVATAAALAAPVTLQIAGDAGGTAQFDGSTGVTIPVTLAPTGVAPGSYSHASITVGADGRVISAAAAQTATASDFVNEYVFRGTTNGSTTILTTDGSGVPDSGNVGNIADNSAGLFTLAVIARSVTGSTQNVFTWFAVNIDSAGVTDPGYCMISRGSGAGTTAIGETVTGAGSPYQASPPAMVKGPQSNVSGSGDLAPDPALPPPPVLAADTVNGGFAISWTPPSSDTWSITGYMKMVTVN